MPPSRQSSPARGSIRPPGAPRRGQHGLVVAGIAQLAGGLFNVLPTGTVCFLLSVPFLVLGSITLMLKTKETKGMSMEELERQFAEEARNAVQ